MAIFGKLVASAPGAVLRGVGGQLPPNLSLAPPNLWLQQQYAVGQIKPVNSYTGGVFGGWEWLI